MRTGVVRSGREVHFLVCDFLETRRVGSPRGCCIAAGSPLQPKSTFEGRDTVGSAPAILGITASASVWGADVGILKDRLDLVRFILIHPLLLAS